MLLDDRPESQQVRNSSGQVIVTGAASKAGKLVIRLTTSATRLSSDAVVVSPVARSRKFPRCRRRIHAGPW